MGEDVETNLGHGWYDKPRRHPRGEAFMRLLVPGTGDFSVEKCYTGDRVLEVVRARECSGAEGNKSRGGYRRVGEG